MEEKFPSETRLKIRTGDVTGIFDLSRYGPCGVSVCVLADGDPDWMTPTEFRAKSRGGCRADVHVWKRVIRLPDHKNKSLLWFLKSGAVHQCQKGCRCPNCQLAHSHRQARLENRKKAETDSDSGISTVSGGSSRSTALSSADLTADRPPGHPDYPTMVREAIAAVSVSGGCSRLNIMLYILSRYDLTEDISAVNEKVKSAVKSLTRMGVVLKLGEDGEDSDPEEKKEDAKVELKSKNAVKKKRKKRKVKEIDGSLKKVSKNRQNMPMYKVKRLTPELSAICGKRKLTRNEVVSRMWRYVKKWNLQDPEQRTQILCDEKLRALTQKPSIPQTALLAYITQHLS